MLVRPRRHEMRDTIRKGTRWGALAALAAMAAAPLRAQAATGLPPAAFERYRLELASAWPELASSPGCGIAGGERLEGELETLGGDRYAGQFRRAAELRFCGTHAGQVRPCQATLTVLGPVNARGRIHRERDGLVLDLHLTPIPERQAVLVRGDCDPAFLRRLEALYRSAGRVLEIPVPRQGEGGLNVGLPDYGWRASVEGLASQPGARFPGTGRSPATAAAGGRRVRGDLAAGSRDGTRYRPERRASSPLRSSRRQAPGGHPEPASRAWSMLALHVHGLAQEFREKGLE